MIVKFFSDIATVESAIVLFVVGVVAAWFRPIGWHDQVATWKQIHKLVPNPPPDPVDLLAWEDPDGFLPFPME
jgi:hypothetical protein